MIDSRPSSTAALASQKRIVPSNEAETIRCLSGDHAQRSTEFSCPANVAIQAPVFTAQTRSVLSWEAGDDPIPSGDQAQALTTLSGPVRVAMQIPVLAFQIRSALSLDAETIARY